MDSERSIQKAWIRCGVHRGGCCILIRQLHVALSIAPHTSKQSTKPFCSNGDDEMPGSLSKSHCSFSAPGASSNVRDYQNWSLAAGHSKQRL